MVENVTIKESEDDEEDQIMIRGRSLESYLKHRIVGDDIETYVDIATYIFEKNEVPAGGADLSADVAGLRGIAMTPGPR